jgi:Uma2 family endonuclease
MTLLDPPISQQFLLEDADWELYEALLQRVGDQHIFVTYDSGRLELISPSYEHDLRSRAIGLIINILSEELDIAVKGGGSTTFRRKDLDKGLEPDQCFYVKNISRILGKKRINLSVDPPPDLAIEVEITKRAIPGIPIYLSLKVPEVWRDDGKDIHVLRLDRSGEYREIEHSISFPMMPPAQVAKFLRTIASVDDTKWIRAVRRWVRQNLVE